MQIDNYKNSNQHDLIVLTSIKPKRFVMNMPCFCLEFLEKQLILLTVIQVNLQLKI